MDATAVDPLVGRVLDERYRIESKVAKGGMATVYVGRDKKLDRVVALKVMHPHLAQDEEFVRRFMGEAKAAAALSHPNVVAVYDQGTDGASTYLSMEYLPGRTLRDLLDERGRLPVRDALGIMAPILSALGAAHRAGLIHRDVKPENVLLTRDGQVKVADFGLARAETDSKQTKTGMIIGTVAYMAPEQVIDGRADARSDVYAAGVLLFELLTGRQPHQGDTPLAVAYAHVNDPIPLPSQLVPGIPPRIDALVMAATSKDPAGRPTDAGHFYALLADPNLPLPAPGAPGVPGVPTRQTGEHARRQTGEHASPEGATSVLPQHHSGPRDATSVLHNHTAVLPPGDNRTAVLRPGEEPGGREDVLLLDRIMHFVTGRFVLVTLGVIASMVIGWAVWYQVSGKYDHVPQIIGMSQEDATAKLSDEGIRYEIADQREFSDRAPKGTVAKVTPGEGAKVDPGQTVVLVLSKGLTPVKIPAVAGKPLDEARDALKAFTNITEEKRPSSEPDGMAAGTDPKAGQTHSPDEPLTLFVSSGLAMPDLVGKGKDDAYAQLDTIKNKLGGDLTVNQQEQNDPSKPDGTVLWQDPPKGTVLGPGSTVNLGINKHERCFLGNLNPFCDQPDENGNVLVPILFGRNIHEAKGELERRGFVVAFNPRLNTDRVISLSPNSGTRLPQGSTVTITH
ncbi:Stk1 family PASTA domain-containing Ser/Thr kinase [Actinocorallia sp. API 0066]|uniref:Stk1 family PASTA domain-containing Ser/Thr kinase n=1 Tax=Actinocorallia sp. API 0066 TaxID=2896846 RepID=UPI001E2A8F31|nr:Stk1 family PASTA domain-containing Ser/Thr kinase [Actinocorallia sp. API 0066]MCD0450958.1 Stk1 family PASTA domain-containing Ser/Thr kinase [Actinocorallia sp. API 0066]